MQKLFFINQEVRKFQKVYIYAHSTPIPVALMMAGILKLAQYDITVNGIITLDDVSDNRCYLNVPVENINRILLEADSVAVVVFGSLSQEDGKELVEYGFKNIFYDYISELGLLFVTGEEDESDSLLQLEGGV